jgi:4-amino-4-deoxy-L-arabinose transferase-like glycosyltransferase
MVERGDWLVPYYQGQPFFDKPALTYWLMAGSFELSGFRLAAARLVPALAALLAIAATARLGRLLFDRDTAWAGALVLGSTLAFVNFGRIAMSDMLLTLLCTVSATLLVRLLRPATPAPAWVLPALGAVLGLGFLTKGPIALIFPGCLVLAALLQQPALPRLPLLPSLTGLLAFAGTGLAWFVAVGLRLGPEPLRYFFLRENLERFAGTTYDSGQGPLFYPLAYLAFGLPWSLLLPLAVFRLRSRPAVRLLLGWALLMAVPLSLSRGKIDYYLLPFFPALSLVIGRHLVSEGWSRLDRGWARVVALILAAGALAGAWAVRRLPDEWVPTGEASLVAAVALLSALGLLLAARSGRPRPLLLGLAVAAALPFAAAVSVLLPRFRAAQPNQAVVEDVQRELRYVPEAQLVACADPARVQRDLLFFARVVVRERCDLWSAVGARQPYLLLLAPAERASLSRSPQLREVGLYRYLPATALGLTGLREGFPPGFLILAANYPTTDPVAEWKRKRDRRRAILAEDAAE